LDLFEYILVITSVVYALAIAQLLSGVARLSQSDAIIRRFLPHTLWVVILFVCILLFWWAGWEFRAVEWAFPKYLYIMITPIFMFYASSLIIPTLADEKEVILEEHFMKNRVPTLWSIFVALLTQFLDGPILADEPWWFSGRILQVAVLCMVIWGVVASRGRTQILPPIGFLLFLVYVSLTQLWTPGVVE
jgi:hypothetical protein